MEQIATIFASGRFGISILLAAGGIVCIFFGYRLFSEGAGLYKSLNKLAIKHNEFSVSMTGMSTGGLLMLTSAAWAFYSYSSIPHFETSSGGNIKIAEPRGGLTGGLVKDVNRVTDQIGEGTVFGREIRFDRGRLNVDLPLDRRADDVFSSDGHNIGNLRSVVFSKECKKWQALIAIKQFAIDVKPHLVTVDLETLTDDQVMVIGLSESDVKKLPAFEAQD